jgi:hypothetical protein
MRVGVIDELRVTLPDEVSLISELTLSTSR